MVLNLPLLVVSVLFFLALVSVFYLASWLTATLLLKAGRKKFTAATNKRILIVALTLPPLLAAIPTVGGATLRHSHVSSLLEHHNETCREMFGSLFAQGLPFGLGIQASDVLGILINVSAWLLAMVGVILMVRLLVATLYLERGLIPYLETPSPRLQEALCRVSNNLPGHWQERFYECAIPATYSSVLGLRRVQCVLSRAFVREASEEELDAVVAHEASHIRAGDVRVTLLVSALNCVLFLLRPVRLLANAWREQAELACDDAAVRATKNPLAMAAAILRASGAPVSSHSPAQPLPSVVMPFADESACSPEIRIERLLKQAQMASSPGVSEPKAQIWIAWIGTLLFGGLGVFVLHSAQMVCLAHCSLEAVARLLP